MSGEILLSGILNTSPPNKALEKIKGDYLTAKVLLFTKGLTIRLTMGLMKRLM